MSRFTRVLESVANDVIADADTLNRLDGVAGDGDLGVTMTAAASAVRDLLPALEGMDLDVALKRVGSELARKAPSTCGTLLATALLRAGRTAGDASFASLEGEVARLALLFGAAQQGIEERGKASPGDKTLLDALAPAREALHAASGTLDVDAALRQAAAAAAAGVERTKVLRARVGRAGWLADRSQGHEDAGAYLVALILASAARTV
jgi:phosphoenolpyruvate---glycerone phosphotransferase subunit DhaL